VLTVFTIFDRVISGIISREAGMRALTPRAAMRYSEKILSFKALESPQFCRTMTSCFRQIDIAIPASMDGRAYYARLVAE
jgi:hypothetical protein